MGTEEEMLSRYQMIFNNLENPVFIMDKTGRTLLANVATYKIYGCTKKQFDELYSNTKWLIDHKVIDTCDYQYVIQTKRPTVEIVSVARKDGAHKDYYVKKVPVFDPLGNVKYVVGWMWEKSVIESCYEEINSLYPGTRRGVIKQVDGEKDAAIIYDSPSIEELLKILKNVSVTDATILLQGETGTGKEVMANYVHKSSNRSAREMVVVNCAAISPALFETEMFGYTKGSFTGADPGGRTGMIEAANGSTLFLDEINSLPMEMQGKLLRVLEEKEVRRVGSNESIPVDFRLVAATNKDLQALVDEGKFRADLFYRLNTIAVTIPPLRERVEDIKPLAMHFLEFYCERYGMTKSFSPDIFRQMSFYSWPGNVRELKHLVEKTILTSDVDCVEIEKITFSNIGSRRGNI